jgi:GNAT superfamily N-acetyltransferase
MNKPFSAPVVTIRPALPSDKAAVLEFCKHIWDGRDYIHYVWDEWMADPEITMFTAQFAGCAVGLSIVDHLAPGQWWFQGFRVDPRLHGQGIGSLMNDYLNAWWLEHGDGVVRLVTDSQRVKVHHLCQRSGFTRRADRATFKAPSLRQPVSAFTTLLEEEITEAAAFAQGAESLACQEGLVEMAWRYVDVSEPVLREVAGWPDGRLWWWRERRGLLLSWQDWDDGDGAHSRTPMVGLAACALGDLPELLADFRRQAAQDGFESVGWMAFLNDPAQTALARAGFTRDGDDADSLFEKKHPRR